MAPLRQRVRVLLPDTLLAVPVGATVMTGSVYLAEAAGHGLSPVDYALAAGAVAALPFRRLLPVLALTAALTFTVCYSLLGNEHGPVKLTVGVCLFTVATRRPAWLCAGAGAVALGAIFAAESIGGAQTVGVPVPMGLGGLSATIAWYGLVLLLPLVIGTSVRMHDEVRTAGLRQEARERADAERLRIAHEINEVAGESLAEINRRAAGALSGEANGEQVSDALTDIKHSSKETLDELRATLSVIRRED
jgi:signal transduction histidine kinase